MGYFEVQKAEESCDGDGGRVEDLIILCPDFKDQHGGCRHHKDEDLAGPQRVKGPGLRLL